MYLYFQLMFFIWGSLFLLSEEPLCLNGSVRSAAVLSAVERLGG